MKIFNKYVCNIYPSINALIFRIILYSADSISRNFSCTDVNDNLQPSHLSWAKSVA